MENKKILIADDNEVNIKILRTILTDAGYDVLTASNGKDAIGCCIAGLILATNPFSIASII